jgi:hypothetical protein
MANERDRWKRTSRNPENSWMGAVLAWIAAETSVSEADVTAEIWRLGTRHLGCPLEGALEELKDPDLPAARAALLRACVRQLRHR